MKKVKMKTHLAERVDEDVRCEFAVLIVEMHAEIEEIQQEMEVVRGQVQTERHLEVSTRKKSTIIKININNNNNKTQEYYYY
jgi:hypothetical protein